MLGRMPRVLAAAAALLAAAVLVAGCAAGGEPADPDRTTAAAPSAAPGEQRYPDVVDVTVDRTDGTFSFTVTISSPYDTPERYADGWRITGPDGSVYGEHTLAHDHAGEQPFTRTQTGVEIPAGVPEVTVEARDQRYGYGGATVAVPLPPA
jgi:transcription initiation factor TFIIIB Brf1 subunit/transcription initiation factor TFIIB